LTIHYSTLCVFLVYDQSKIEWGSARVRDDGRRESTTDAPAFDPRERDRAGLVLL
jgi:hypothetical protein